MVISSKPTFNQIKTEYGTIATPPMFTNYVRGNGIIYPGNPQNASIATTAANLRMTQFAGGSKETVFSLSGNIYHFNVQSSFNATYGAPTQAVLVRVLINPGCHIFYNSVGAPALNVGAFPAGSLIIIENRGQISGARGTPNSGVGGDAIWTLNGTPTHIYNYGTIAPGGGAGGVGGQGGMGYWQNQYWVNQGQSGAYYWCDLNSSCQQTFGGNSQCDSGGNGFCSSCACICYNCQYLQTDTYYTYGGAGGAGGYGWGSYDSAGNISGATGGNGGGGPDTNAGWGGTGGTGGGPGSAGATGNSGGGGNWSGGSGGGGGGAGGRWIVYNSSGNANLAFNSGTIYGGGAVV